MPGLGRWAVTACADCGNVVSPSLQAGAGVGVGVAVARRPHGWVGAPGAGCAWAGRGCSPRGRILSSSLLHSFLPPLKLLILPVLGQQRAGNWLWQNLRGTRRHVGIWIRWNFRVKWAPSDLHHFGKQCLELHFGIIWMFSKNNRRHSKKLPTVATKGLRPERVAGRGCRALRVNGMGTHFG